MSSIENEIFSQAFAQSLVHEVWKSWPPGGGVEKSRLKNCSTLLAFRRVSGLMRSWQF